MFSLCLPSRLAVSGALFFFSIIFFIIKKKKKVPYYTNLILPMLSSRKKCFQSDGNHSRTEKCPLLLRRCTLKCNTPARCELRPLTRPRTDAKDPKKNEFQPEDEVFLWGAIDRELNTLFFSSEMGIFLVTVLSHELAAGRKKNRKKK